MTGPISNANDPLLWTAALALCAAGLLAGFAGLLFPRLVRLRLVSACCTLLLGLLAVVLVVELITLAQSGLRGNGLWLAELGLVGGGAIGLRVLSSGTPGRGKAACLGLALISLSLSLGACQVYRLDGAVVPQHDFPIPPEVDLIELTEPSPRTDKGTPIPMFRPRPPENGTSVIQYSLPSNLGLERSLIRTAPADPQYNCHGWVFTGGQYHVTGRTVDQILQDNGYQQTSQPQAGDLIIYRNEQDGVTHTGLVRALGPGGFVLIESKWGAWSRFLHEPAAQCYGQRYAYYHSPRPGHLLTGLSSEMTNDE
jgi:hypothetical protein